MSTKLFENQKEFEFAWRNDGLHPRTGDRVTIQDAIATSDAGPWLPKVTERIVREAAEPLLVGASLLQRMEYHAGQQISFPWLGALHAADLGPGQAYPERKLSVAGATTIATVGKVGIAVSFTEEMVRYSQYDVINMHLRACGRALARHKEEKIFNFIRSMGVTCFDNKSPTTSLFGVTHGRDLEGDPNGSAIMDDIFDAYAQIITQGFTPDTLLMHPLTWAMFVKDPVLRQMALASGTGTFFATRWTGNPAGRAPWSNGGQGKLGPSSGQTIVPSALDGSTPSNSQTLSDLEDYPQNINSAPELPGYFPFPFKIIVSPFVRFVPSKRLTDIMIFDSAELGALIVDEEVMTDEWNDKSVDIQKIKMRERYGVGIFNEGKGIGVLRNVKVVPNEVVLPAQATQSVSGTVAKIPAFTALSV